jgi:hypothetical protein
MKRAGFPEVLQLQSFTDFSAASAGAGLLREYEFSIYVIKP